MRRVGDILLPETPFDEGFLRGEGNGSDLLPYVTGSPEGVEWRRGYRVGQAARACITDLRLALAKGEPPHRAGEPEALTDDQLLAAYTDARQLPEDADQQDLEEAHVDGLRAVAALARNKTRESQQ